MTDTADIQADKAALERAWSATHSQWAKVDTFTNGKYNVWPSEHRERGFERTNRGRIIIDHVSDNILPYHPKIKRETVGEDIDAERDRDATEKAADAIWTDASRQEKEVPAKLVGRYMAKDNYAIFEAGFDDSGRPQEPEADDDMFDAKQRAFESAKANFNPFILRAPHPYLVLLPPNDRKPDVAVRRTKWYRGDLQRYLEGREAQSSDDILKLEKYEPTGSAYDLVNVIEHFTPEVISLMADGKDLLLQEKNPHLFVPFVGAWGGFGDKEANDDGMAPEKMGQGILWPVLDLILQYDQLRSAKMELFMKAAYGMLITTGDGSRLAELLEQGGNAILDNINPKDIGFLPVPQIPQMLSDLEDRIDREIVDGTIPRAFFGQREVGVDTVGVHAMMLTIGFKRFVETLEQMSYMTTQIVEMWLRMWVTWGKELRLGGVKEVPSILRNNYHVTVTYPLTDEAVKMQRKQQGAAEVGQGLKSRKRYWEDDDGLDDTHGEEEQIDFEQVMRDPILVSAKAEKIRIAQGVQEMYEEQVRKLSAGREGVESVGAPDEGPGGTPPNTNPQATAERGQVRQAIQDQVVKPAPASPGSGQRG